LHALVVRSVRKDLKRSNLFLSRMVKPTEDRGSDYGSKKEQEPANIIPLLYRFAYCYAEETIT
jgi:hypothetical protein